MIGAGAAGLASAALARRAGLAATVLDGRTRAAGAWPTRYDALRLNTVRWMSDLPGLRADRSLGRWPTRDDYASYLDDYARWHDLDIRLGVTASRVVVEHDRPTVVTTDGTRLDADAVVVATGHSASAVLPGWDGVEGFRGTFRHAATYRDPEELRHGRTLVVGGGSSGGEIVLDLLDAGCAVTWSVRSAPHLFPREVGGVPTTPLGALGDLVPPAWVDRIAPHLERMIHGPRDYLPAPPASLHALLRRGKEPMTADGIVDAVRSGRVAVVPAVARLDGALVELVDGSALEVDHVVAATGYRPGLEPLVGDLDVLDDLGRPCSAVPLPRLGFVGFRVPLGGTLWAIEPDARRVVAVLSDAVGVHAGRQAQPAVR